MVTQEQFIDAIAHCRAFNQPIDYVIEHYPIYLLLDKSISKLWAFHIQEDEHTQVLRQAYHFFDKNPLFQHLKVQEFSLWDK